jgi:hypothetical protein
MPTEEERRRERLDQRLEEYLDDTGGERKVIKELFNKVLAEVHEMRVEVADVRGELRGVKARVTLLEDSRKQQTTPPRDLKDTRKIEETYEKTPTGTFRLTDFELHDLHAEAATWRGIKSFARSAAIPVTAAVIIGALAIIYAAVWHPTNRMATPVPAATWQQAHPESPTAP